MPKQYTPFPSICDEMRRQHDEFEELKKTANVFHRFYDVIGSVQYRAYYEVRRTNCGVWVQSEYYLEPHWFNLSHKKRFAYETKAAAWESFCARKRNHRRHLRRELEQAERVAKTIELLGGDFEKIVNGGHNA